MHFYFPQNSSKRDHSVASLALVRLPFACVGSSGAKVQYSVFKLNRCSNLNCLGPNAEFGPKFRRITEPNSWSSPPFRKLVIFAERVRTRSNRCNMHQKNPNNINHQDPSYVMYVYY